MNKNEEKGIIIDGIDVFACNNIIFEHDDGISKMINVCECGLYQMESYDTMCSDNPECYYKQMQREKQKNKKLTEDFNEICKRHNEAFEEFNKLKQTNEKLRKTFKEIEEIAEDRSMYCENCDRDTITCEDCGYIKILEKTKEVEND